MKWSISQLKKFNNQSFNIDETVTIPDLTDRKDVTSLEEVRITGEVSVFLQRVEVQLSISTVVNMLDSRTSEDIQLPLQIDSLEIFDETVDDDDDLEDNVHPIMHSLDLDPVLRELIIVNIPQVYSKSDEVLSGGKDWDVIDRETFEREKNDKVDPRLEKLKSLMDSDEDKEE